jgi:hypothetical protein
MTELNGSLMETLMKHLFYVPMLIVAVTSPAFAFSIPVEPPSLIWPETPQEPVTQACTDPTATTGSVCSAED